MPVRYAVASGNWSSLATWNGGASLPTASDDCFANGFNVTIDQNINVLSINSGASGSAVNGGSFISTNGIAITASGATYGVTAGTVSSALLVTGSHTVYLSGSVRGGAANQIRGIQIVNNGNLYITGSVTGGTVATLAYGVFNNAGRLEILGNIYAGSNTTAHGVAISNGTTIVTGNLYSSLNATPIVTTAGSGSITIIGDTIVSSNAGQSTSIYVNGGTGIVNFNGTLRAFNVAGIVMLSACTVNITGSLYAGNGAAGIQSAVASTVNVTGSIYASTKYPAISSTSTTANVRVAGLLYNNDTTNAIFSPNIEILANSNATWQFNTNIYNINKILTSATESGYPSITNVRQGVIFGNSNQFTGTISIPSASNVLFGVPIDNTTGSATLTQFDILNYPIQNLTGSNTIGDRLKNISTVQTTAANIAAFNGI